MTRDPDAYPPGGHGTPPAASLLTICSGCHQLHAPDRPLAFHPVCRTCTVGARLAFPRFRNSSS